MQASSSNPEGKTELSSLIRTLTDSNVETREKAAAEIFRRGSDLTASVRSFWLEHQEFARLFVHDSNNTIHTTVGVAVTPDLFEKIRRTNGTPRLANVPPDQDAVEFELEFHNGARLDVLTTQDLQGSGAIARYLQKFGMGIQQIEFLVSDVDKATALLQSQFGVAPIYPQTRPGANNTRVNFFLIATPENKKILVEFVEAKR